jgi:predicted double-glycine peptidase
VVADHHIPRFDVKKGCVAAIAPGEPPRMPRLVTIAMLVLASGVAVSAAPGQPASVHDRQFDRRASRVEVPVVRQTDASSCGVACLLSIFRHEEIDDYDYESLALALGTSHTDGTDFRRIVAVSRRAGLCAAAWREMSLKQLVDEIDRGRPVIVSIQAYAEDPSTIPAVYYRENANGHYVVAVGHDADHVYFMDPSLEGRRAYLTKCEFVKRWHDNEGTETAPRIVNRLGLVIYRPGPPRSRAGWIE